MDYALLAVRLILAATFGVAGVAKLLDLNGSREAMKGFGVPARYAGSAGAVLPVVEVIVGLALLSQRTAWWGAIGGSVLLAVFVAAMLRAMARGEAPDCHCFGQLHSEPVGWPTLVRNAVLLTLSLFVVWQARDDAGAGFADIFGTLSGGELALLAIAVLAVTGAAGAIWLAVQLMQQQGRILLRLEELERLAAGGPGAARPLGTSAQGGLATGTKAPPFELPSVTGGTVRLEDLLDRDKMTLLVFSDPGCGPCNLLMPKVAEWQRKLHRLTVVVVSRGSLEANRAKAAEYDLSTVLVQDGHDVFDAYAVQGTPGGVLLASDGTVASELARGTEGIERLVARASQRNVVVPRPRQSVGLAPGTPAPEIPLTDLDGKPLAPEHQRGERLMLFWNPQCSFCQRMLPELKSRLGTNDPGLRDLIVVTRGSREENLAMGLDATIALDSRGEVGRLFGSTGTPSAVLIDMAGRVASEMAIGAGGVWQLVDGRRAPVDPGVAESRNQ